MTHIERSQGGDETFAEGMQRLMRERQARRTFSEDDESGVDYMEQLRAKDQMEQVAAQDARFRGRPIVRRTVELPGMEAAE